MFTRLLLPVVLLLVVPIPVLPQDIESCKGATGGSTGRFLLHEDGTATDQTTGLTWMRCTVGQRLRDGKCITVSPAVWFLWSEALSETTDKLLDRNLSGGGWRLPELQELQSLQVYDCGSPAINTDIFPDPGSWIFWSRTVEAAHADFAWAMDFARPGATARLKESTPLQVRLVRGETLELPDPEVMQAWEDGIHDPLNEHLALLQPPAEVLGKLPAHPDGGVDWNRALDEEHISPRTGITAAGENMETLEQTILYTNTGPMPYVLFSHRPHSQWLACENCHDRLFPTAGGPVDMGMQAIWEGDYCGRCHGTVAFSAYQCVRCHSVPHKGSLQLE